MPINAPSMTAFAPRPTDAPGPAGAARLAAPAPILYDHADHRAQDRPAAPAGRS
jgi:hypothetical protein